MTSGRPPGSAADAAAELGTVLGVWAHPDDEAYLAAGLMAAAVGAGGRVVCVTATRGEGGGPAAVREAELAAALAILGVAEADRRQLGYVDGRCHAAPAAAAARRIADVIAEVRPATVLTFGPDGLTGHPDHRAVSRWTTSAVRRFGRRARPRLLYAAKSRAWCTRFAVLNVALGAFPPGLPAPAPDDQLAVDLILSGELLDRKVAALRAHASQVGPVIEAAGQRAYRRWVAHECFRWGG